MPRKQDFTQSVIYHIRCIETKRIIYVGSTTQFSVRKAKHKYKCNTKSSKDYNYPIYSYIRDSGGFDNFEVIPVIFLKLENKTQLAIEEQKEMDKYSDLKNKCKSHRTEEQKREQMRKLNKKYREENSDKIKRVHKEYRENNREHLHEYNKVYRENNREKVNEKMRKYREKNADKLAEYTKAYNEKHRKEKITCCCGKYLLKCNKSIHEKTKKHQNYMKTIQ